MINTTKSPLPKNELEFIESLPDEEVIKLFLFTEKQINDCKERMNLVKQHIYRRGISKQIKEQICHY